MVQCVPQFLGHNSVRFRYSRENKKYIKNNIFAIYFEKYKYSRSVWLIGHNSGQILSYVQ